MRIPIQQPQDRALAAESLWMVYRTLEEQKRTEEANLAIRELLEQFSETRSADRARAYQQNSGNE
jgi:TolA-binding protein